MSLVANAPRPAYGIVDGPGLILSIHNPFASNHSIERTEPGAFDAKDPPSSKISFNSAGSSGNILWICLPFSDPAAASITSRRKNS